LGRGAWLLVAVAAVVSAGLGLAFVGQGEEADRPGDSPGAVVANDAVADGWQTVEYQDVAVDLPDSWQRVDNSECRLGFEHWGPEGTPACAYEAGVKFFGSANYDPRYGPGLRRSPPAEDSRWSGYVYVEPWAVFVAYDDRDVARHVLLSARPADK
jgi:hypothetical protein